MPRFHFNVYDGVTDLDTEGMDLPNLKAAQREALHLAAGIIRDQADWTGLGEDWRIEVTDDSGLVLFRMDFVVVVAAGVPGST